MYGEFVFSPSLDKKPATDVSVSVIWEDIVQAPWRSNAGGVYAAWTFGVKDGPAGYMGAQIKPHSGQFIFSIWDGNRWNGRGHSKTPKASNQLVWPLDTTFCKRNCQDCALAELREWKRQGLTTGTKCLPLYPQMKTGGRFDIRLRRTRKRLTINTRDYGGMPAAHAKFGEKDREITGAEWVVEATDVQSGKTLKIGRLLFEGSGAGLKRLKMFDEMLGCNHCNDMYHRDTRYGPILADEDGAQRKPQAVKVRLMKGSSCKQYRATGKKEDGSVTFEGGPGAVANFPGDGTQHSLW